MSYSGLKKLQKHLPDYAQDIKKNLEGLFSEEIPGLTVKQTYGIALATGYFFGNEQLLNDIRSEAKFHLDENDADAAKIAVITTSMASTYYNFHHIARNCETDSKLNLIRDHNVETVDFELYSLAISILINCNDCIQYHVDKLQNLGISDEGINNLGKIVAALRGAKAAIEIESIRSYDFIARGSIF